MRSQLANGDGPQVTMLLAADRVEEPWRNGGGSTREIAALPGPHGPVWRLSMARVEADGPFSVFSGVTRTIMVMAGDEMSLNIAGVEVRIDSEPFTFDGGAVSYGALRGSAVTDFNVMIERGQYDSSTQRIAAGRSEFDVPSDLSGFSCTVIVVAPASGAYLEIKQLGIDVALSAYDAIMIDGATMPLHCQMTSPDSGALVVLTPDQGE